MATLFLFLVNVVSDVTIANQAGWDVVFLIVVYLSTIFYDIIAINAWFRIMD